jgi:hypothetical protein
VQVQRWLGHHSPSFTLDTYVHLLDADLGEPLQPSASKAEGWAELPGAEAREYEDARDENANALQTCPTPLHTTRSEVMIAKVPD